MAIELTTLLQYANNVGVSGQKDDKQIFISEQGDISGKSGLGFFKRHFSSSARMQENRATLQAFEEAISANPRYRTQLKSDQVARFFKTKHDQGTPLTARDVKVVRDMLEIEKVAEIGGELVELGLIPNLDATGFAWFCVGNGLSVGSPEGIKDALKTYYASQHLEAKARQTLLTAGVPRENLDAAMKVLQASSVWSSALDGAFEGDVSELTHDIIMTKFGSALEAASDLLGCMSGEKGMNSGFLMQMATSTGPQGISLFNGALEAIRGGAIVLEEGPRFMGSCLGENYDLSTPELLNNAIGKYCATFDAENRFISLAVSNGLPGGVGKALANNPEFKGRVGNALLVAFPPPGIPTREQVDSLIEKTATEFLAEKNDAIRGLLDLVGKTGDFNPTLVEVAGEITEQFICEMLNPLLAGPALVSHLLDPAKGTDPELVNLLENFQTALLSCQHTVEGEFGADELTKATERCLAVIMGARGADEDSLELLLAGVNRHFTVIGPSMDLLTRGLTANRLETSNLDVSSTSINYVQSIMGRMAGFAHSATTSPQRERLGIDENLSSFLRKLHADPGGKLYLVNVHQSVRAFALARGVDISQEGYEETNELAISEAKAFTGDGEHLVVTDLLRARSMAIAEEIGLTGFDPDNLDLVPLESTIARAVRNRFKELLNPAQARELAEQAIREHLQELKSTLDFITGLPTVRDPNVKGQFVITSAEKARLLRTIPGTPLRDPELIKTVLLEAQALEKHLRMLTVPGLGMDDIAESLMNISKAQMQFVDSFHGTDKVMLDEHHAAYRAALGLALDALQLGDDQTLALFNMVSGNNGLELRRGFASMVDLCKPPQQRQSSLLKGSMRALDHLCMLLGPRVGVKVKEENSYYTSTKMNIRDVPGVLFEKASSVLKLRSIDIPGYGALSMVSPKLSHEQWDTLMPILRTAGKSIEDPFLHEYALKMIAANARELLDAAEANRGKELSPAQIWQVVIGGKAPSGTTADNLGARMYQEATARILQRVQARNPDIPMEQTKPLVQFYLGRGIPFQTLYNAYQPGGRLGMADLRFGPPTPSSLSKYNLLNAYGLVTDWGRRGKSEDGNASTMTIHTGEGRGFQIEHRGVPEEENVPTNPIFVKIMESCRSICRSDLPFSRVMQSLSQAGTVHLRMLAENFPGLTLSEHSHFDSTVTPQPNGNIVVELANGPDDRPFGAHIQITVTPEGETTVTDIGVELRG
jgi:hypothetical protein